MEETVGSIKIYTNESVNVYISSPMMTIFLV